MIDVATAQAMARDQARLSARQGKVPFQVEPQDFYNVKVFCRGIPFLGDRPSVRHPAGPPMWKRADVRVYLPEYPYMWFFVDSSGWGADDESALSVEQFANLAGKYTAAANAAGYQVGFGTAEAGQFQVRVAPYLRKVR